MQNRRRPVRRADGGILNYQQKTIKKSCEIWLECIIMDVK
jgi:hypothetical protein